MIERRIRLFRNGRNQAVRIPREFQLLEIAAPNSLLNVLATLPSFEEELPEIIDPRPRPVNL